MKNYSLLTNDNETIEIDIEKIQELKLIMELVDSNDDDMMMMKIIRLKNPN